ncbi:MAG: aminopeptidase, partial [Candidatus Muiribacteriaceae bacterium]
MKKELFCKRKNGWEVYSGKEKKIFAMADEYKAFLDNSKTERTCVKEVITFLEKAGYRNMEGMRSFRAGTKFYSVNRGKTLVAGVIGKKKITEKGVRYLVSHVDVPHLHLKPDPIFEDSGMVLVKTQYYGGIKKHHWLNV